LTFVRRIGPKLWDEIFVEGKEVIAERQLCKLPEDTADELEGRISKRGDVDGLAPEINRYISGPSRRGLDISQVFAEELNCCSPRFL
jgi:hypothetical protein